MCSKSPQSWRQTERRALPRSAQCTCTCLTSSRKETASNRKVRSSVPRTSAGSNAFFKTFPPVTCIQSVTCVTSLATAGLSAGNMTAFHILSCSSVAGDSRVSSICARALGARASNALSWLAAADLLPSSPFALLGVSNATAARIRSRALALAAFEDNASMSKPTSSFERNRPTGAASISARILPAAGSRSARQRNSVSFSARSSRPPAIRAWRSAADAGAAVGAPPAFATAFAITSAAVRSAARRAPSASPINSPWNSSGICGLSSAMSDSCLSIAASACSSIGPAGSIPSCAPSRSSSSALFPAISNPS
mmetsp:Transcript_3370/g.12102  ORF Transcript_3370/g.12102 Transcript_3370/m.12102 type:complete len:311 (+) Transcript_3370:1013-1945(+)